MGEAERLLATKEINWKKAPEGQTVVDPRPISASIEADRNNGKTSFFGATGIIRQTAGQVPAQAPDDVRIDVISKAAVTNTFTTTGTLFLDSTVVDRKTEFLVFAKSKSATLSAEPDSSPIFTWLGSKSGAANPSITVDGKTVNLSSAISGLLKVEYDVNITVYRLTGGKNDTAVFFENEDGEIASVQISFKTILCNSTTTDVTIVVQDRTTGLPVPGANVSINGTARGQTGGDGKLVIGSLARGQSYRVGLSNTGYIDNDKDCLDNEEFTL